MAPVEKDEARKCESRLIELGETGEVVDGEGREG